MKRIFVVVTIAILCLPMFSVVVQSQLQVQASSTHIVYFTEQGVAPVAGYAWSVTFNGVTKQSGTTASTFYTIEFDNVPDATYPFTVQWVQPPGNFVPSPSSSQVIVSGSDKTVAIAFNPPPPPTYTATISAYCYPESASVSVAITEDGLSTGFYTSHTFSGLSNSHTFAVPSADPSGHLFKQWSTGQTSTTMTVSSSGTYTAYYQAAPLWVSVSANPTTGNAPLSVQFTGAAYGGSPPYSYSWGFGEGSSSNLQNPSHAYQSAGNWLAILVVTDSVGAAASWSVTITVLSPPPQTWKLTVASAHDSPLPGVGDHLYFGGSSVTCSVTSPVVEGGVSYNCTGWTGTGSIPSSGSGVSTTFTITADSTITWNWIGIPTVDFSISATSPLTIVLGNSANSTVTVTGLNGFTGTVNLAIGPAAGNSTPTGTQLTLAPQLTSPYPTTTNLMVAIAANPPISDFWLNVTGTSGSLVHFALVHIILVPSLPATHSVFFEESGVGNPAQVWSVVFDGYGTEYSNGPGNSIHTITFTGVANGGPYQFIVTPPSGFVAQPTAKPITVSGSDFHQPITFTAVSVTYTFTLMAGSGGSVSYSFSLGSGTVLSGQPQQLTVPQNCQFSLTANPDSLHVFQAWSTTGSVSISNASAASITATVNGDGVLKANFAYNLGVSISPLSASIRLTQSVTFIATPSGGSGDYTFVWHWMQYGATPPNDGSQSTGASSTYTFSPSNAGNYGVYVIVTDSGGNPAQSVASSVIAGTHSIDISEVSPRGTSWWRAENDGTIEVNEGQLMLLEVTIKNTGDFIETFDLHLSYQDLEAIPVKSFPLKTQTSTLLSGGSTVVDFEWDTKKSEPLTDSTHSHHYDILATAHSPDADATHESSNIRVQPVLPKNWLLAPQHENSPATIKWEFPDNFVQDGSAAHNHRRNKPFYALCVWDDRVLTYDVNLFNKLTPDYLSSDFDTKANPWYFYYGHGFISSDQPLRYYFVDKTSWPKEAIDNVTTAFEEYSKLADVGRPDLATGIFFKEVTSDQLSNVNDPGLDAEIVLCWRDLGNVLADTNQGPLGITRPYKATANGESKIYMNVTFNSRSPLGEKFDIWYYYYAKWYFGDPSQMPEGLQWDVIPVNYYHFNVPFYSTALHEIGHALGLPHINDPKSIMYPRNPPGARAPSKINGEALDTILDLYSIPAPSVTVTIHSPANLYITDPTGRHIGFDPTTNLLMNDIPYGKLSDIGSEPENITISWPLNGVYQIQLIGTAAGNYTFSIEYINATQTLSQSFNGTIYPQEKQDFAALLSGTTLTSYMCAQVHIDPKSLNLGSKGKCISACIELPEGFNASYIDPNSLMLNSTIQADLSISPSIRYNNGNGIPELMVNFNRTQVSELILAQGIKLGNVTLTVTGQLNDGTPFEGITVIRVRMPGDINCDGKVDGKDIALAALSFGTVPGDQRWNAIADESEDNKIDGKDIVLIALNFGKTYT